MSMPREHMFRLGEQHPTCGLTALAMHETARWIVGILSGAHSSALAYWVGGASAGEVDQPCLSTSLACTLSTTCSPIIARIASYGT